MGKILNYIYNYNFMVRIFVFLQSSCVEILMPDVMELVVENFGKCLSHEGGILINVISAF